MKKTPQVASVEPALARKIQELRAAHGWTYEQMAEQMEKTGHSVHPSAIQKTEKSGRRVVVDELLCYSRIFGIPVGTLIDENVEILQAKRAEEAAAIRDLASQLAGRLTAFGATQRPQHADGTLMTDDEIDFAGDPEGLARARSARAEAWGRVRAAHREEFRTK